MKYHITSRLLYILKHLKSMLYTTLSFFPDDELRKRRRRTAFTDEQRNLLEESFEIERFPGIQIREDLARKLDIGEDRIQVR